MNSSTSTCPKCGNEAELFAAQPRYADDDPQHTKVIGKSQTFRCQCGLYFTHEDNTKLAVGESLRS